MGLISWMLLLSGLPALLLAVLPVSDRLASYFAKAASAVILFLSLQMILGFDAQSAEFQYTEKFSWIPELGISYEVGVDGISLFMVLLTSIATLAVLFTQTSSLQVENSVTSAGTAMGRLKGYCCLFLFLELSLIGVFVALDLVMFFVFFELMLLPSFLLINGWGSGTTMRTAIRFVLYTALGSSLMLCSIIYLGWVCYNQSGNLNFSLIDLSQSVDLSPEVQAWLFLGFFIAFAVKSPIAPFHSWLPATYTEAPTGLTAFMSAVMAKAGLYGIIRFNWNLFPSALNKGVDSVLSSGWLAGSMFSSFVAWCGGFQHFLIWLLALGVLYSALIAWSQRNAKTLMAYSSVSHLAVCAAAIILCSANSITAAVLFMFAHGLVALGLFLSFGSVARSTGTAEIVELGGLVNQLPKLSTVFFIFLLGSIAVPLSVNFAAEFMVLISLFSKYPNATIVAATSVVIGAVYMLSFYRRVFFGKQVQHLGELKDLSSKDLAVYLPLAALVLGLGIFPTTITRLIEPSAQKLEKFIFDSNYSDATTGNYDQGFLDENIAGIKYESMLPMDLDRELNINQQQEEL